MEEEYHDIILFENQSRWFARANDWVKGEGDGFLYIDNIPRRGGATIFMCAYFLKYCVRDNLDMCLVTFSPEAKESLIDTIHKLAQFPVFLSDGTQINSPDDPAPSIEFLTNRILRIRNDQTEFPKHKFVLVDNAQWMPLFGSLLQSTSKRNAHLENHRVFGVATGHYAFPKICEHDTSM